MVKSQKKIDRQELINRLSVRLKLLKERIGFTRSQLARTLGISSSHLYKLMQKPDQASEHRFEMIQKWLENGCPVCGSPLNDGVNLDANHQHEGK